MILCIGLVADETFLHTLSAFERAGVPYSVADFAQMALSGGLDYRLDKLSEAAFFAGRDRYVLASFDGVWARLIDIADGAPEDQLARKSAGLYVALTRLLNHVSLRVMNPPPRDCSNFAKLFHAVNLAGAAGWRVPRSCLTNNPERAAEFIDSCDGDVIFKGASAAKTWATQFDPDRDRGRMELLRSCPALFQERIRGPDVRVHLVGRRTFAEVIESGNADYRVNPGNVHRPIRLPDLVAAGCTRLRDLCGLPLLGIDFKISAATGEWFFLEANSLPCYQGYDRRAGGAISRAIVEWVAGQSEL